MDTPQLQIEGDQVIVEVSTGVATADTILASLSTLSGAQIAVLRDVLTTASVALNPLP